MLSADSAVKTIMELEPRMIENDGDELLLESQKDHAGEKGDVRDILIRRETIQWEVGLSIKHNHEAIKHSRLSHKLDFGQEWFGIPCSEDYWNAISPIFDTLKRAKSNRIKWSELDDKENDVYIPLLQAFMDEINKICVRHPHMPEKMVEYLIGINDYYKTVSRDAEQRTMIQTFNIHNTLNQPSRVQISAIRVPTLDLPTELIRLKFKTGSRNTVEMYFNHGWQMSFRIHNARTMVEPSLKFDIQFTGMPVLSILNIECKWFPIS